MSNEKHYIHYNGYSIDCLGSEITALVDCYAAADGDRMIIISLPDIEERNAGAIKDGDAEFAMTAQQAKRLARRLLKLATEKIKDDDGEELFPVPELREAWSK